MTFEQMIACESLPQPCMQEPYVDSTGRVHVQDCHGDEYVISQGGDIRYMPDAEDDE